MDAMVSQPGRPMHVSAQPFLAADVGGTHARIALVRASDVRGHSVEVLAYRKFVCSEHSTLDDLLQSFVETEAAGSVRGCVLACAGHVLGDDVMHDNLAWPISLSRLRGALALDELIVLNDFEALGYALVDAQHLDTRLLCGPDRHRAGPTLVVGPGTGLGAAVHVATPAGAFVIATEAGQMDFAPRSLREREVLARLAPDGDYVPCERVLSGPGLLTLYRTLCELHGEAPTLASPEAVGAAARTYADRQAGEAVDVFCASLGSFVGNLAMAFMAGGGVYLAGGFLSSMFDLLQRSDFAARFLHERSVRTFLERVPVRVMEHGQNGVLGAARFYVDRRRFAPAARESTTECSPAK
ncbi:MAG TPA: glucokinase [Rhodanobacteraceae bacterium]|nr:glucokinase [Rhodanobacteraceae bacterium]